MKITLLCLIGIILLGIVALIFSKVNTKVNAQIILTAILIVITAAYAYFTYQSVKASKKMAEQMLLSNQINYRPYVLIEGVPTERTTALTRESMEIAKAKGLVSTSKDVLERGFITGLKLDTGENIFMYSFKNIGNVPAHNIKFDHILYEVDKITGATKQIKTNDKEITLYECLFPGENNIRSINAGKNVFFRSDPENKFIRIRLKVTYEGIKDIDTNKYFTIYQWRFNPARTVEEMQSQGVGNVVIEITDEGIE